MNGAPAHTLDTGPLLCFGAIPQGPREAWRLLSPMQAPAAVVAELERTSRRRDAMAAAAGVWLGTRGRGLTVVSLTENQTREADSVQAVLHSSGKKDRPTASDDRGEAECIALALSDQSIVATNDAHATKVAMQRGLGTVTIVDLLRRDFDSGYRNLVDTNKLVAKMRTAGLDIGENIAGPLDLKRRSTPPIGTT